MQGTALKSERLFAESNLVLVALDYCLPYSRVQKNKDLEECEGKHVYHALFRIKIKLMYRFTVVTQRRLYAVAIKKMVSAV